MSNRTPGPWVVEKARTLETFTVRRDTTGTQDYPTPVAEVWLTRYDAEANARLIAAAPEMLEALKALLKDLEEELSLLGYDDEDIAASDLVATARAAIAKAEGRNV